MDYTTLWIPDFYVNKSKREDVLCCENWHCQPKRWSTPKLEQTGIEDKCHTTAMKINHQQSFHYIVPRLFIDWILILIE